MEADGGCWSAMARGNMRPKVGEVPQSRVSTRRESGQYDQNGLVGKGKAW